MLSITKTVWSSLSTPAKSTLGLGFFLIITDVIFALLHVFLNFGYLSDRNFHLEIPGGYAESFGYLKFSLCLIITVLAFLKFGKPLRLVLALTFLFLLLEDSLELHENIHDIFQPLIALKPFMGLSPHQLWEFIYGIMVGGLLLLMLAYFIYRSKDIVLRNRALVLLLLFFVLGGFGLVVDTIHGIIQGAKSVSIYLESLLGLIEEFGEMISVSLISAIVWEDYVSSKKTDSVTLPDSSVYS